MKKISIVIPTYNEEENVKLLHKEIINVLSGSLPDYEYEIIFIDNKSTDETRVKIKEICVSDSKTKAIFNAKNFGQFNSPFYGLTQSTGDCTILMCADFQDPINMIPKFVKEWENGFKIVIGIKSKSRENGIIYLLRSAYYKMIKKMSNVEQIEHFTGFGLYDKDFIKILADLKDPAPFLRGIVAELGFTRKEIEYTQEKRKFGITKNNWYSLYDAGMLGITSYTKVALRLSTFIGFTLSGLGFLLAMTYLVLKLMFWNRFAMGTAPILLGIFLFGSVQLFFIGLIGEYILMINTRLLNRPLVVEEDRVNF